MKLLCWNINGLRAAQRNGIDAWMRDTDAELYLFQETKAQEAQLDDAIKCVRGYRSWYASAEKKGYSGVALYVREDLEPDEVRVGFDPRFDGEGRVLGARFGTLWVYSVYFPNGQASPERLAYKMAFYEAFLSHMKVLRDGGASLIVGGDFNTAHTELDLARPKENEKTSGFLPIERAWLDEVEAAGFVDSYRRLHPQGRSYSWWSQRLRARDRDVGWRIDYFFVGEEIWDRIEGASIHGDVYGSDHCPIGLDLRLP